VTKDRRSN